MNKSLSDNDKRLMYNCLHWIKEIKDHVDRIQNAAEMHLKIVSNINSNLKANILDIEVEIEDIVQEPQSDTIPNI